MTSCGPAINLPSIFCNVYWKTNVPISDAFPNSIKFGGIYFFGSWVSVHFFLLFPGRISPLWADPLGVLAGHGLAPARESKSGKERTKKICPPEFIQITPLFSDQLHKPYHVGPMCLIFFGHLPAKGLIKSCAIKPFGRTHPRRERDLIPSGLLVFVHRSVST